MKKILAIIYTAFLALSMNVQAFAASASVGFSGDATIKGTGTTTITLSVSGVSGLDGVCGVSGVLSYDSSKVTLTGASANNGFTLTQGNKYVAYRSTCVNSGSIFSLTFKNNSLADGGTTVVSFSGVRVSSDAEETSAANASKTITYKAAQSSSGSSSSTGSSGSSSSKTKNSGESNKKDENKGKTEEKKEGVKAKSNDSSLSEITFSVGKIDFNPETFNYDLVVNSDVNYIEVNAKSSDSKAKISGVQKYDLKDEKTEVKIVVTAEDGSVSTYTVNVLKDKMVEKTVVDKTEDNNIWTIIFAVITAIAVIVIGVLLFLLKKKNNKKNK